MFKKKETEVIKHIMNFCGVEILGRVLTDSEMDLARLETVKAMIQNAFIPKAVKEEIEKEKILK